MHEHVIQIGGDLSHEPQCNINLIYGYKKKKLTAMVIWNNNQVLIIRSIKLKSLCELTNFQMKSSSNYRIFIITCVQFIWPNPVYI